MAADRAFSRIVDVEVIFFYPWAVIFREMRLFGLAEMGVFVGMLFIAYIYIWKRGGLEWESILPRPALKPESLEKAS
ncbi:MAG: NADH-quinone oxidoreductase subunit A [Actinobacteria bacterium]|nr:NADH-quinone oxidoreductase subunit A [Actinomycetota bacterium]